LSALIRESLEPPASSQGAAELVRLAPALRSLRQATSVAALLREAASALCDEVGFQRAAVFSFRAHALKAESVHVRGSVEASDRLRRSLAQEPVRLGPWLHEAEALRRRMALLVKHDDPHALGLLPGGGSYVIAPVIGHDRAVALLHADHGSGERAASGFDRAALWAFAEGLSYALERCVLEERLQRHSQHVLALARAAEASVEELGGPALGLPARLGRLAPSGPRPVPERARLEMLTPREHEVLAGLAEGETNAQIAQRLVVSEDTVKTHVKHILRKLGVRNRSQAVSHFFRTHAAGAEHELTAPVTRVG
jgi:DNA-binding CsgD family transcriptional regulator